MPHTPHPTNATRKIDRTFLPLLHNLFSTVGVDVAASGTNADIGTSLSGGEGGGGAAVSLCGGAHVARHKRSGGVRATQMARNP